MFNNAEQLQNTLLNIYFIQYNNIADKGHMDKKYDPENFLLQGQRLNVPKKKEKVNHSWKKLLMKE